MPDLPKLSIQALQLVNEHRTAYGLRYNDFTKYRNHCANRTHRLRSTLKMTHGKGREFKKLPAITSANVKDGHLQLLLTEAERAWAYSQELNAQSLLPVNESSAGALRHKATGRFRRAVNWATRFLSLCQDLYKESRISAADLVQATIYTLILNGRFLKHRDEFEDALIQLSVARNLLDELAAQATTSRNQALATLFADEIGTEIRHCAYQLGWKNASEVDNIVKETSTKHRAEIVEGFDTLVAGIRSVGESSGAKETLRPILWEGTPVPIRNPELVGVLLAVQNAESVLAGKKEEGHVKHLRHKKGVAAFDAVLSALSDAEDIARKLKEAQQATGATTNAQAGTRDLQFIHAYIVYQLLSRRTQRDLLLVSTLLKESGSADNDARLYPAVVKLLDTVIQGLDQMRYSSVVDESQNLSAAIEARVSITKARKCLYLARAYAPIKRYGEALTLVHRGTIHLRETRSVIDTEFEATSPRELSFYPLQGDAVDGFDQELATEGLVLKKTWFAYNGASFDADPNSFKKPVFFDIALNYVQLDMDRLQLRAGQAPGPSAHKDTVAETKQISRTKETEVEQDVKPPPTVPPASSSGGLSSLLGGWWGRK